MAYGPIWGARPTSKCPAFAVPILPFPFCHPTCCAAEKFSQEKRRKKMHPIKRLAAARLLTLAAGALLLVLGMMQGGYRDTLVKAVHICLECVGIG